jgi:hypothetical protein
MNTNQNNDGTENEVDEGRLESRAHVGIDLRITATITITVFIVGALAVIGLIVAAVN